MQQDNLKTGEPIMMNGHDISTGIGALRAYFPNLTIPEIKELSKEDRDELASLARAELLKTH